MGEPAGKHDGINIAEMIVLVPEQFTGPAHAVKRFDSIVLAIGARKDDNTDFRRHMRPSTVLSVKPFTTPH